MNTVELIDKIKAIALSQPIQSVFDGDVYENWNSAETKYGSVNIGIQDIVYDSNLCTYSLVFYYGDRLLQDKRNVNRLYADGVRILQSIINQLNLEDTVEISGPITYHPFAQQFSDYLAGVYATVEVEVESELGLCDIEAFTDVTADWLKFTALEDGSSVGFQQENYGTQYSFDGITWNDADKTGGDVNRFELNSGDTLYIRSIGVIPNFNSNILGNVKVSGNINTANNYKASDLDEGFVLDIYCYQYMFGNCEGLTDASELVLPSLNLPHHCYQSLFRGCVNLVSGPAILPSDELLYGCYQSMFDGCTSLVNVPELPAMTLAGYCYYEMFKGCTSLTQAPVLPATYIMGFAYERMFEGCTALEVAPELPGTVIGNNAYAYMFKGCTGLTQAPVLPGTELYGGCYMGMFNGCSNLNYIKCYATDISATACTMNWVAGVAENGTFEKPADMDSWETGESGIPEGWEITEIINEEITE